MRFGRLYPKLPRYRTVHHGDEWSRGEREMRRMCFSEGRSDTQKEQCPVLLSHLSVAGGEEQRKLVGCGVSHVCLTLSDSLLCYSLTHSAHSLQEMCDSFLHLSCLSHPHPCCHSTLLPQSLSLSHTHTLAAFLVYSVQIFEAGGNSRWKGRTWNTRTTPPQLSQRTGGQFEANTPHTCPLAPGRSAGSKGRTHLSPRELVLEK